MRETAAALDKIGRQYYLQNECTQWLQHTHIIGSSRLRDLTKSPTNRSPSILKVDRRQQLGPHRREMSR